MTPARIFLLCLTALLFFLMFLKPGNALFEFTMDLAGDFGEIAARVIIVLWALLAGYCAYALTAMVLSFSRIETFSDLWLLLRTRPSRLGGPGSLGVLVGVLFAAWAYKRAKPVSLPQTRFIRGRQMAQPLTPKPDNCLDRAAKTRDLNKVKNPKI